MNETYIYDAVRTPRGKGRRGGSLRTVPPIELVKTVLTALRVRNELDTALLDDVILGCVEPVGEQGADIARVGVLYADYDQSVPGAQVNRFCASGLVAVNLIASQIMSGQTSAGIGGGVESMSRVPMGSSGGAWVHDPRVSMYTRYVPQGISADLIATLYGYSREQLDELAVQSQQRAAEAWTEGRFAKSIVPVCDPSGAVVLDRDELMRPQTSMATLAGLKPAFERLGQGYGYDAIAQQRYPEVAHIHHLHHAGNSSGIVDGAAGVLLGDAAFGRVSGLRPRARIVSFASVGSEPTIMLTGPATAARVALKRAGLGIGDIDLWEINEAFASVVMRFEQELGLTHDTVNVNGGAIAMGHPLGATGAMILGTLLDELERRDARFGLAALCVGAGMGTATIVERVAS